MFLIMPLQRHRQALELCCGGCTKVNTKERMPETSSCMGLGLIYLAVSRIMTDLGQHAEYSLLINAGNRYYLSRVLPDLLKTIWVVSDRNVTSKKTAKRYQDWPALQLFYREEL